VGDLKGLAASVPHACLGLLQYFERRAHGRRLDGSVRFLYKMARELQGWVGDSGTTNRSALKALVRFGLPPSTLCPDDPSGFDRPLEPHLFAYGELMRSLRYVRFDPARSTGQEVLGRVRSWLAAGFPCLFGFVAFDSITNSAEIACPTSFDKPIGGLCVVATGHDDSHRIRSSRGALRIRNCWGEDWGVAGYGWLPYEYIERGLATDFWTLLRAEWLATGEFGHPGGD
jgi:C1A family cysteine protease